MFKRLIAAYGLVKESSQYLDLADSPDFWTQDNAAGATSFFASETGQRLRARLRNIVFRTAIQACATPDNSGYECGKARGVLLTVQAIEQHLNTPATAIPDTEDDNAE